MTNENNDKGKTKVRFRIRSKKKATEIYELQNRSVRPKCDENRDNGEGHERGRKRTHSVMENEKRGPNTASNSDDMVIEQGQGKENSGLTASSQWGPRKRVRYKTTPFSFSRGITPRDVASASSGPCLESAPSGRAS